MCLLNCLGLLVVGHAQASGLRYEIAPFVDGDYRSTKVTLTFRGNSNGACKLHLPPGWFGGDSSDKKVEFAKALSPRTTLEDATDPSSKIVHFPPDAEVQIVYEIRQDGPREKTPKPFFYHFGESLWAVPDWNQDKPVDISLDWKGLPPKATLCNSFGTARRQHFKASIGDFRHGTYLGGDFRLRRFQVRGQTVTIARRGTWKFTDAAFDDATHRLFAAQSDICGNARFLYPLVVLYPTDAPSGNFGGEGRTRCFDLFLSKEDDLSWGVLHLLSHELFHSWNPTQLRWDGEKSYWFTEGFTDYFGARALVEAKLGSTNDFIAYINRTLKGYYLSPSRNHTYDQLMSERDGNYDSDRLIYARGCLQALNWDTAISQSSDGRFSLKNFFQDLLRSARRPEFSLNDDRIEAALAKYLGKTADVDLRRFIQRGETILPRPDAFNTAAVLDDIKAHSFDLGFDGASFSAKVIAGTRSGSNAYLAGVRDGQKILAGGFQPGNADALVQLKVSDNSGEKTISYFPQGAVVVVPQFRAAKGSE